MTGAADQKLRTEQKGPIMYSVLIADDEGIMLEALKNIITSNFGNECELAFAKTGRAVVELAESFRPDMITNMYTVILDIT